MNSLKSAGFEENRRKSEQADLETSAVQASAADASSLLETLLASTLDIIYFKDLQSRFVRYSRSLALHFGLSDPEALRGKTDFDCHPHEHARLALEDEQRIIRTGEPLIGKLEQLFRADGRTGWFLTTKMPWRDAKGNVIGTFGVTKDVTELKEAEAKLAEAGSLLETLLDNSPDSLYFKDRESRFVHVSEALVRHFHMAEASSLRGKTDFDFFTKEHAQPAYDDEQEIIRTGKPIVGKPEKETHPDGRVTWCLTTKMPWCDKDGNIIGTFGTSKDMTAIKESEAKLEEVHNELLAISRRAGMAEVASSVLHNVGNVLNSVNVSATIITDRVRASKASGVTRIANLLAEHRDDLARFLAEEGRLEQVIDYLNGLAQHLSSEQATVLDELGSLTRNVDHIKEIVAMQQSYAQVSGVMEIQSLSVLVEDALRVHATALAEHQVRVVRHFDPIPDVLVDKHKVLQILVNLISNAVHALSASTTTERVLTLSVSMNGDTTVRVSVADNGIGIQPENLTRIFAHGFTTRPDGHGFGLHSGSLAAREMSGTLIAHSDGPGRGATFTLELPSQPKEGNPRAVPVA